MDTRLCIGKSFLDIGAVGMANFCTSIEARSQTKKGTLGVVAV